MDQWWRRIVKKSRVSEAAKEKPSNDGKRFREREREGEAGCKPPAPLSPSVVGNRRLHRQEGGRERKGRSGEREEKEGGEKEVK
ncbi:hypothetical protein AXF42_Ash002757 [Apostasia shenzhenica]|uniref:Uncharacterized protein n=1 Tax=Apostasia shenzhenica TaxID=1088818 RepID=A0A2I0A773_9ASPA|nr:hypothetical protein AXF42_Ash002757 [Apostasia shenzhenica]